jgi:hypothetical protein
VQNVNVEKSNVRHATIYVCRLIIGDRTEYLSYSETDACSQCKARGLAASCKPQYDPRDAPSPEPDIDLRDRVARLEAALLSLTGRSSPGNVSLSSPPQDYPVGTAVASGTDAASFTRSPYQTSPPNDTYINPLYSVSPPLNGADVVLLFYQCNAVHRPLFRQYPPLFRSLSQRGPNSYMRMA